MARLTRLGTLVSFVLAVAVALLPRAALAADCPPVGTFISFPGLSDGEAVPSPFQGLNWTNVVKEGSSNPPITAANDNTTQDVTISLVDPSCNWGVGKLPIRLISLPHDETSAGVAVIGYEGLIPKCNFIFQLSNTSTFNTSDLSSCGRLTTVEIAYTVGTSFEFNIESLSLGSAKSDPHIVGANGAKFDFDGQLGGSYALFSAPQFQVNMRIAGDGPKPHFMTEVGLLFRDESFHFTVVTMDDAFRDALQAKLVSVGGHLVAFQPWEVVLELCPGQRVTITQKHTTEAERELWHADGRPFYYLDVAVAVPGGCDDAYDGVLGQTYQCRYLEGGAEAFEWSSDQEEAFRLPGGLFSASGAFAIDAPCIATVGGTDKKGKDGIGGSGGSSGGGGNSGSSRGTSVEGRVMGKRRTLHQKKTAMQEDEGLSSME